MNRHGLFRTAPVRAAFVLAALTSALALEGCGRKGMPVPLDPAVEQKAADAPASPQTPSPTANYPAKLPKGVDDNSLKAGARKTPTPFDFLL